MRRGLARCRLQLGELDAAWALLQGIRAEQPGHVGVLTESARVELGRRRPAEAEALLKLSLALARAPTGYEAHALLARSLQEQGRAAEAEAERAAAAQKIHDELLKATGQ